MTVEEFVKLKEIIKSLDTNILLEEIMKNLNDIKNVLSITKMMVLELQVRKEVENGKEQR